MASYSERDLGLIPELTFSFVETFIKASKKSSGEKSMNKGFKYFSEGYIQDLKVKPLNGGCEVTGRCYRSQRKTEKPHQIAINFVDGATADGGPTIPTARCTCPTGLSGACGHIVGTLYQLAKYKTLELKALPGDVAKTSQPQSFHIPRGEKIQGKAVQDLDIKGYSKPSTDSTPRGIKSTLYNPIRGQGVDWKSNIQNLSDSENGMLGLQALQLSDVPTVSCKFGVVPVGCVLSYQQKNESDCVINLYDETSFPELPSRNIMENSYHTVLTMQQTVTFESIKLDMSEIKRFEQQTRLQSQTPLWYKIRKNRITASNVGDVYKRQKNHETLVARLKSTRHVSTAAMRQGLASEPTAALAYATENQNKINLYPCGVVVSLGTPWIAASPDRKVYNPDRQPAFGLLEIKCPQVTSVLEAKYLFKDATGQLRLKRNHSYYFQILTQLAVTGLSWCDLFVWCPNDHNLETIYFNQELWQQVKDKIDEFYFSYFL